MGAVNTLVITGYGTNSHLETAHAARLAGADRADVVHFSDIVTARVRLDDYHFLIFPGGFLDGDDLGAAQTASLRWRYLVDEAGTPLIESLTRFLDDGKLVLGICNGFQLLVKLGVLPLAGRGRASSGRSRSVITIPPATRTAGSACAPMKKAPACSRAASACWPCRCGTARASS